MHSLTHAPVDVAQAWALLRGISARPVLDVGAPPVVRWQYDAAGQLCADSRPGSDALVWFESGRWCYASGLPDVVCAMLDLYLPICGSGERLAVGHLGQSLDGHIATETGDSIYVTDHDNIVHLHRMRALCDAVVVGAQTVFADDPRLTTRLVDGEHPVRVVLDPKRRLKQDYNVFADGQAPTLLICQAGLEGPGRLREAEVIGIPLDKRGRFELATLRDVLGQRGLNRLFVEGGGVAVSAFVDSDLLERLHIAVAPLLIGSGRPGIRLPVIEQLADGHRPSYQVFQMGGDVLFDLDLRSGHRGRERDVSLSLRRVLPR
ncbi:MAG: RibD family protein [Gammaproteobacteria bacterium]|nr:RibD family protein [Gammaproteobacteria bacterium]